LESLDSDDILEVLLDGGEPMDNVPKNLEADGYNILKIEKTKRFLQGWREKEIMGEKR